MASRGHLLLRSVGFPLFAGLRNALADQFGFLWISGLAAAPCTPSTRSLPASEGARCDAVHMQYVPAITMAFSISRDVEAVNSAVCLWQPIKWPKCGLQSFSEG
jgi:hypothetical protein